MGQAQMKSIKPELTKKEVEAIIEAKAIEAKAKAAELSTKLGVKVHPITFIVDAQASDFVIGYIKEPGRLVKMRAMDKVTMGQSSFAYQELLEACILKDVSDERILSEKSENDKYNLGAANFCGSLLIIASDLTEKKN